MSPPDDQGDALLVRAAEIARERGCEEAARLCELGVVEFNAADRPALRRARAALAEARYEARQRERS